MCGRWLATMADGIAMSVCIFKAGVIAYVCLGGDVMATVESC